jgi:hypothetical protein
MAGTVKQLTAIIEREGDGFVALCPELDMPVKESVSKKRGPIYKKRWNSFLNPLQTGKSKIACTKKCISLG